MQKSFVFIPRLLVGLCGFLSLAAAPLAAPVDLYGPLFVAVQSEQVFADGKTFVDATPRLPVDQIMSDYERERPTGPDALRRFVEARFVLPDAEIEAPHITQGLPLREHIQALWPILTRPPLDPPAGSSALPMPEPYVVPGGRFREIYYWDSYFTMLGLKADGRQDLVESMLVDFEAMVEAYGHVPNGARSYYISRSQPPFLALMVGLSERRDTESRRRQLDAMRREHGFWMAGASCAAIEGACGRVVRMPDGALLNRYWDDRDTPRDESYREDVETAHESGRPAAEVYRALRAGAESGWDFSSRWQDDPMKLATIQTSNIVPVDLNSLLWSLERSIAAHCRDLQDEPCVTDFDARAASREQAMNRYLWSDQQDRFGDWDRRTEQMTDSVSAAALYPLFTGWASTQQAAATSRLTRDTLLAPGGLRTTVVRSGQQWDAPNGWAPLQWVAVSGLRQYGETELSDDIAARWMGTVSRVYAETGKLLEKYDIEESRAGGGGEYPLQDGFGWTNGVASALLVLGTSEGP